MTFVDSIRSALTPDLLRAEYRNNVRPFAGHCYVASEAYYHLIGKAQGYSPMFIRHENAPHWFLSNGTDVIDLTADQFVTAVPYHQAKGKGFLTSQPSKRATLVMQRVLSYQAANTPPALT